MRQLSLFFVLACVGGLFLSVTPGVCGSERYTPDANSLGNYVVPQWYQDAKFGLWVHRGIYSLPAFQGDHASEWYGRWIYAVDDGSGANAGPGFERRGLKTAAHHRQTYGDPSQFGYKDFIPMFKAEKQKHWSRANFYSSMESAPEVMYSPARPLRLRLYSTGGRGLISAIHITGKLRECFFRLFILA